MSRVLKLVSRSIGETAPGIDPSISPYGQVISLTSYERMGTIVMAVAGVLSCVLVSCLLLYIMGTAILHRKNGKKRDSAGVFASKQIAIFVTCLLFADLIQSISGITQVKWAREGKIYEGMSCQIQAATLVMGDLASTVWSCVIAAHTFSGIALNRHWSKLAVWLTVIFGWIFVIILTFIIPFGVKSAAKGPYFAIAGTWCFISSEYAVARLVIHYIPLFVAALVIVILYGLIFLFLRGTIGITRIQTPVAPMGDVLNRQRVAIAKRMLWYPIGYLVCIFPISVTRLVGLKEQAVPEQVWIFAMFFLFSLGSVDTVIYATTRNVLKPINLPFHMVTLSPEGSGSGNRTITSGEKRQNEPAWPGAYKPRGVATEESLELHDIREGFEGDEYEKGAVSSNIGGIQVTLERVREVI
ncbi:hypothetical protein M422DRAFT_778100 [Sphaerobolus stellatus SS14]|nr:hypothetical protein M422DRAFT_778100 [Sphaerobolus stellatus SS14]